MKNVKVIFDRRKTVATTGTGFIDICVYLKAGQRKRLMKVTDNSGTTPNLTAQDGTKLTVVKLVENPYLYDNNLVPMINYMLRNNYQQSLIFLDNKPYESDYKF